MVPAQNITLLLHFSVAKQKYFCQNQQTKLIIKIRVYPNFRVEFLASDRWAQKVKKKITEALVSRAQTGMRTSTCFQCLWYDSSGRLLGSCVQGFLKNSVLWHVQGSQLPFNSSWSFLSLKISTNIWDLALYFPSSVLAVVYILGFLLFTESQKKFQRFRLFHKATMWPGYLFSSFYLWVALCHVH